MTGGGALGRAPDERGFLAGSDGFVFGVLILGAGMLLLVNAWSIVEHHTALDAASREYLRVYTEQRDAPTAQSSATEAARRVLDARGTPLPELEIRHPDASTFGPCQPIQVELRAVVPLVRMPFIDDLSATEVAVTRGELVDPHRELDPGHAHDPGATPCGE